MPLQLDISVSISSDGVRVPLSSYSQKVSSFTAQVKRGNVFSIWIGGPGITNTGSLGIELAKPVTNVTQDAFGHYSSDGSPIIELQDWYINGTAGDGVNIIAIAR